VYYSGHRDSVVAANALRDSINKFRYTDPDKLPARAPALQLSSESHSFSRVFSGAFYDLLVGLYTRLRTEDASLDADGALAQACSITGHLFAQGLTLAPKGDALFKTIASSMLAVDAQNQGRYFAQLSQAFVGRGILTGREAEGQKTVEGTGHTHTSAMGMATAVAGASRLELAEAQTGEEIPSHVRQALKLPHQEFRLAAILRTRNNDRVLHYVAPRTFTLTGRSAGLARDAIVNLVDAVAIQVGREGQVISSHEHAIDRAYESRVRTHVSRLVERGRVYSAIRGERVTPALLIERKQPYYVSIDPDGSKHIRRGFIACGGL
jgi:hypothetical protein